MNKLLYILIGIIIGISFSVTAQSLTWRQSSNYYHRQANDKTPEVQIWCELRSSRDGWESYCEWNGAFWKLTCKGMERFFGEDIEPTNGGAYGCYD